MFDLVLVGGGLANALLAFRLRQTRPEVSFVMLEAHDSLGRNHTWSFQQSDVTPAQWQWLQPLISRQWPSHSVRFNGRAREMPTAYATIRSEEFSATVMQSVGPHVRLSTRVSKVEAQRVTLESGEVLQTRQVVDARGFVGPQVACGFQKFLGLEVETVEPHGLTVPLVMDATVAQLDGFRFVYCLPFTERRVLIEDTYYADDPGVDRPVLRERVRAFAESRGWQIARVLGEEAAALPIPLEGEAPQHDLPTHGVAAGLFNATTGYSLPWAAHTAEFIAAQTDWVGLAERLNRLARDSWAQQRFFRLLNRMLFKGAAPERRVQIFEAFYGHDDALIGRFYAGRLTLADQLSVLAKGAPTVPALRAMRAALG